MPKIEKARGWKAEERERERQKEKAGARGTGREEERERMQVEILGGISRSKILAAARQPFSSIATGQGGSEKGVGHFVYRALMSNNR